MTDIRPRRDLVGMVSRRPGNGATTMSRVVASNVCYRATAKITSMADMKAHSAVREAWWERLDRAESRVLSLTDIPQVDQRIGAALAISLGTSGRLKPHSRVEPNRLSVLFIYVGGKIRTDAQRVSDKGTPHTGSSMRRINKQRLHMATAKQHESNRPVPAVYCNPERGPGQKAGHLLLDITPVVW